VGPEVLEAGIAQGVKQGLFGLGELEKDTSPVCRYFREDATVSGADSEILIREDVCLAQRKTQFAATAPLEVGPFSPRTGSVQLSAPTGISSTLLAEKSELGLRFHVPRGKITQTTGIMNFLQSKFQSLNIEITARDGSLSDEGYTNKIKEAFKQLGANLEEAKKS
jgi:hypothetical protein